MNCPHGMGKAASCVECMAEGPVAPLVKEKLFAEFWLNAARYDGECGHCHEPITVGDPIGRTADYGWCCENCCQP